MDEKVVVGGDQRRELDLFKVQRAVGEDGDIGGEQTLEDRVGQPGRGSAGDVGLEVALRVRGRTRASASRRVVSPECIEALLKLGGEVGERLVSIGTASVVVTSTALWKPLRALVTIS